MYKIIVALMCVIAIVAADTALFAEFKLTHGKEYASVAEEAARYSVFKENLAFINAHNADSTKTFTVGINRFADMTNEEFRATILSPMDLNAQPTIPAFEVDAEARAAAGAPINWVKNGNVPPVLNQGQCGSCWSFSASEAITAAISISSGNAPVTASPQNLMDCSKSYGNNSCEGGLMTAAFQYVIDNGGIDSLESYPYLAQDTYSCKYSAANSVGTISSMYNVTSPTDLQATVQKQPVSIAIDASHMSFQFYSGGIYTEPACSSTQLDHGVLLVGIGAPEGSSTNAYIVRNSWGAGWGVDGNIYMNMEADNGNQCGVATMATIPLV